MDYQRFIAQLPNLYENWGQDSVRPKSEQFQQVWPSPRNDNSKRVSCSILLWSMESDEIYCEIGTYRGSTLIGALLNHPERMAYAVDNFSEFDTFGVNLDKLTDNLSNFGLQEHLQSRFWRILYDLRELGRKKNRRVFYDGAHDYRSNIRIIFNQTFLAEKLSLL